MANRSGMPHPGDTNHDEEIALAMQRQFQRAEKAMQREQPPGRQIPSQTNPRRSPPVNQKAPQVNLRAPPAKHQRPANQQKPANHINPRPPPNNRGTPLMSSGTSTVAVNADDRNFLGHFVATQRRDKGPIPFSVIALPRKKKKSKGEHPPFSSPHSRTAFMPAGRDIEEEKVEITDEDYAQRLEMSYRSGDDFDDEIGNESHVSDAEYARRLEQELQDEHVAEKLQSILDQNERAVRYKRKQVDNVVPKPRRCTKANIKTISCFVILCLIIWLVQFLWQAFVIGDTIIWGDIFPDNDPYNDVNPGESDRWKVESKTGLKMTMLNGLDARWQPYFEIAMSDWDSGIPDAVTLTSIPIPYEKKCDRVRHKVKVCNGDYGAQDWKGLCMVYYEFGYVAFATVKLNDFYFKEITDPDEINYDMQYTMCHELGHSLGLAHTDENFHNKDLGNCMDYTHNPKFNMRPDDGNFQILFSLYGEVNFNIGDDDVRGSMNNLGTRFLEEAANLTSASEFDDVTTDILTDSWWRKLWKPSPSSGQIKLLFESKFSKLHVQDLGNGQTVLIHKILP